MTDLRQELHEYFGMVNRVKAGVKVKPEEFVDKPDALIYFEQMHQLDRPLIEGGVLDQPHIFMQEYAVCAEIVAIYAAQDKASQVG